ncbi:MAG: hypothetical protein ABIP79_11320 [Chitinophagaceae bacterium]
MKKFIGFLMLAFILSASIYSCQPDSKKEVIVVPATTAPIIIEKAPAEKGTTITLDKNGVKVKTKKINIDLKQ